jgi:hypothetical protein
MMYGNSGFFKLESKSNISMKNVFKALSIAVLVSTISITAPAQLFKKPGITFGANLYFANPQGDFKNEYKGGLGGEVKGGVGLGNTYVVATLGYTAFAAKSGNEFGTLTSKPMKIGIKRYFLAKRLFINSDLGVTNLKDKTMSTSTTSFSKGIGGGVRLLGMEAALYYDSWGKQHTSGTANSVLFKIGYNLTL